MAPTKETKRLHFHRPTTNWIQETTGRPDTVVDETEESWRKDIRPVMNSFQMERDALEKKVDALLVQIEELNKKKRDYKSNARTVAEKKPVESEELI